MMALGAAVMTDQGAGLMMDRMMRVDLVVMIPVIRRKKRRVRSMLSMMKKRKLYSSNLQSIKL
jgi:hypothetical protein